MLSLQSEIDSLCAVSHELLHLGLDGEPIYSDRFRQLNTDVYHRCEHLFGSHGRTLEEEASLCIALLTGYNATIYNHGDKEDKIQSVLNRSWDLLDTLPVSLLKCRLLVACYAEVFDEELAAEAHAIIDFAIRNRFFVRRFARTSPFRSGWRTHLLRPFPSVEYGCVSSL